MIHAAMLASLQMHADWQTLLWCAAVVIAAEPFAMKAGISCRASACRH